MKSLTADERESFRVSDAKEWSQIVSRGGVKIWTGKDAADVREQFPDRFMDSRMIRTFKNPTDGSRKSKSR